jgi:hypothetical protein
MGPGRGPSEETAYRSVPLPLPAAPLPLPAAPRREWPRVEPDPAAPAPLPAVESEPALEPEPDPAVAPAPEPIPEPAVEPLPAAAPLPAVVPPAVALDPLPMSVLLPVSAPDPLLAVEPAGVPVRSALPLLFRLLPHAAKARTASVVSRARTMDNVSFLICSFLLPGNPRRHPESTRSSTGGKFTRRPRLERLCALTSPAGSSPSMRLRTRRCSFVNTARTPAGAAHSCSA